MAKEIPAGMRKVSWGEVGKEVGKWALIIVGAVAGATVLMAFVLADAIGASEHFWLVGPFMGAALLILFSGLTVSEMKPQLVCTVCNTRRERHRFEKDRDNPRERHCPTCFVSQ